MNTDTLKPKRILVVEDDHIMLKAITNILNKGGYNVHAAKDGKEAFEMLDSVAYDIIITDILLPYASGFEVIRKIRQDPTKKNIGIIAISSMTQDEVVAEAFSLGVDDYLKKPLMARELLLRIPKLLANKNIYSKVIRPVKPIMANV